jgi:hypothetical protein
VSDDEGGAGDDVAAALAILRDAGFPVERIRILPATSDGSTPVAGQERRELAPNERAALLAACRAALDDGQPRAAKELLAAVRGQFSLPLTRKDINSVLAREGKDLVTYDRETYTYRLRQ